MTNLHALFSPKAVAVVGVSHNSRKLGTLIFKNLLPLRKYSVPVYPVNIKGGNILGVPAVKSLTEIKENVDLVVVSVPAPAVFDVVKDAIIKKVRFLIIITAGFKETGPKGALMERRIAQALEIARNGGIDIHAVGVNCLGVISYESLPLNASFLPNMPPDGDVAFLSQSGAFGAAVVDKLRSNTLFGLKYFVSIGNKTDLNEIDFLDYFVDKPEVKTIAAYLEDIKVPRVFVEKVEYAVKTKRKNVVILLAGASKMAQKAIGSHTGSMVKDVEALRLALRDAGAVVVESIEELFNTVYILRFYNQRAFVSADDFMILTNAGGPSVITLDLLSKEGMSLAKLDVGTKQQLIRTMPYGANVNGPVDILGDADAQRYQVALQALSKDQNISKLLVLLTPQVTTEPEKTAKELIKFKESIGKKQFFATFIGGEKVAGARGLLQQKLPSFDTPADLVRSIGLIHSSAIRINRIKFLRITGLEGNTEWPLTLSRSLRLSKEKFLRLREVGDKVCTKVWREDARLDAEVFEGLLQSLGVPTAASVYIDLEEVVGGGPAGK